MRFVRPDAACNPPLLPIAGASGAAFFMTVDWGSLFASSPGRHYESKVTGNVGRLAARTEWAGRPEKSGLS
jgi:hypothetical protein